MVHLAYPDAVMNIVLLLAALVLCAMAARNRTKNIYEADVTKGNINYIFSSGLSGFMDDNFLYDILQHPLREKYSCILKNKRLGHYHPPTKLLEGKLSIRCVCAYVHRVGPKCPLPMVY